MENKKVKRMKKKRSNVVDEEENISDEEFRSGKILKEKFKN